MLRYAEGRCGVGDEAHYKLELVVPRRVVFERLALRHRNNGKAKGLSIPIVRNKRMAKKLKPAVL